MFESEFMCRRVVLNTLRPREILNSVIIIMYYINNNVSYVFLVRMKNMLVR